MSLAHFAALKNMVSTFSALGDDYILARITSDSSLSHNDVAPIRFDGVTWILCLKGSMTVDVNLQSCRLTENSLTVCGPDSLVQLTDFDRDEIDMYALFISTDFMANTNIDPNVVASIPVTKNFIRHPGFQLTQAEGRILARYFELIHLNTTTNDDELYIRSISRSLVSALCYQAMQITSRRTKTDEQQRPRTRRMAYVAEFMQLVHKYHNSERTVRFYADKLFISPKYLSILIKEATGKSAAEWIDEFVILEAKNLLRFSGKNIQQVAYALNFPNQSSFGKYFKHITGMSPSQYIRS